MKTMMFVKASSCSLLALMAFAQVANQPLKSDALRTGFVNPPASARPRVWWHWMNGNITEQGIKLDLDWMKRVGIGGLQNFDAALSTPQVVEKRLAYMTPEWKEAFRYAVRTADQLGLEVAIASSPGWSETGGPWVKPEKAMKKLVWTETSVTGGREFEGTLAQPSAVTGPFQGVPYREDIPLPAAERKTPPQYYSDAAVIAYRVPDAIKPNEESPIITSSSATINPALLHDGDLNQSVKVPVPNSEGGWIQYAYPAPVTLYAVTLSRPVVGLFSPPPPFKFRFESSTDGAAYQAVADLPFTRVAQQTISFAPVTARFFRLKIETAAPSSMADAFEPAPGVDVGFFGALMANKQTDAEVNELVLHTAPRVNRFEEKAAFGLVNDYYAIASAPIDLKQAVTPADVVDLTRRMKPDGSIKWTPPAGRWNILRFGYSLTGTTNHPATAEATGLEVDKLDSGAVKEYIDTYLGTYKETLGPQLMGRHGVKALLTDSIEVGAYNWTPDVVAQFKRLRGYDPTPYLPALTGVVVGSAQASDRFLWDFRRTLGELTAQSHYGQIAKSAHERSLTYYGESLEGTRVSIGDDMEMRQNADIPMSAMWTFSPAKGPRSNYVIDIRGAASVAHIYGQNLVAAESMTSALVPWGFSPRILKPVIDLEFALGVNRPVIHTSVHQPLVDKKPGLSLLIFGQYFNRNETWAELAEPWVTYISRNAHMLQQGKFVADVAYFYGEEAPLSGLYGEGSTLPKDLPEGYGFDFVNSDVILHKLSVANGRLVTPSGMQYRLLYLGGSSREMTLPVLRKLQELVQAGAVLVGDRPIGSPSLADNPSEFNALADQLWGKPATHGKVIAKQDATEVLASLGMTPDFEYQKAAPSDDIMFVHRHLPEGEVYFLSNRTETAQKLKATFRVSGKVPELWHADAGTSEPVSFQIRNGRTTVPLELEGNGSVFVVFRQSTAKTSEAVSTQQVTPLATVNGNWEVHFAPRLGAPEKISMSQLSSWPENADTGVKYFSGTATYMKELDIPAAWLRGGERLLLDLGDVRELAEVNVNGQSLGIRWHPPYKVDITDAAKAGSNKLEIKVTNLWVNRLIGDQQPGATKITYTVAPTYKADAPLRPSGLLGPVTVERMSSPAR